MKRIITFILAAITGASILFAQKDQEWSQARREIHENILMTGSNFKSYMEPTEKPTRSPKGYEPFYISTYARHGSRWLCSDSEYTDAMGILERAHEKNNLTERGELLREQLNEIHETAINRIGDLTPLGEKQHHGIGKRMCQNFPEIFGAKNCQVDATSSVVIRCILSMVAECEEITAYNPKVAMHNESSQKFMYYISGPREQRIKDSNNERSARLRTNYKQKMTIWPRFWAEIMKDTTYRDEKFKDPGSLMRRVFDICRNMQSHEGMEIAKINLWDLFTEEEVYGQWYYRNINNYIGLSSGLAPFFMKSLLENFLNTADTIVNSKTYHGATLRFGHEVCLMPLAALLELDHCYPEIAVEDVDTLDRVWSDTRIFPMASNVQLIFYRPKKKKKNGDILVKAMLNEHEVSMPAQTDNYPYYKWADLEAYYRKKIADYDSGR